MKSDHTTPNLAPATGENGFDEDGYRKLIELSPMPIGVHIRGTLVFVNSAAADLVGYDNPDELIGKNVMDFVHPDSREVVRRRIASIYEEGNQQTDIIIEKILRKDGSILQCEIASLFFMYQGERAIQLLLRDVTERERTRMELEAAKQDAETQRKRLNDLFMQAPAYIMVFRGPDHVLELVNPMIKELIGITRKIDGLPVRKALPDFADIIVPLLDQVYRTGIPYIGTEMMFRIDPDLKNNPKERYFNFVYQPSYDSEDKIDGILAHAVEVTEHVIARKELEYTNTLLHTITQNATLGLFMMDEHQRCTFMNAAAEDITGFKFSEVRKKPLHYYVHHKKPDGSYYPLEECPIDRALPENNREQGEELFVHKDGSMYPVRFTASPIRRENKPIGTVIEVQDLTEEKKAQAALVSSKEHFKQLADSMPQMVWTATPDGCIDYLNRRWFDYTGFRHKKITLEQWQSLLHPDDRERAMEHWSEAISSGTNYQTECRMHDGSKPVKYRWFLARAVPVHDEYGSITKWFGTTTDIEDVRRTKKRTQELEHITSTLKQQRAQLVTLNAAKDEFISLASHQLRTPATGVKQFLGMVLEGYAGDISQGVRDFLYKAYQSNERQIMIVNDLLKVAQVDAGKVTLNKKRADIVALIASVIREQQSRFDERKQRVRLRPERKRIFADVDPERLRMVLDNVIDNASKYTPHGKNITVNIATDTSAVRVEVLDEGVGIEQADLDKIFKKFSRVENPLSAHVGGSGLGLYWVRKIIDLHGGVITVDSKIGKGSRFSISLPRS